MKVSGYAVCIASPVSGPASIFLPACLDVVAEASTVVVQQKTQFWPWAYLSYSAQSEANQLYNTFGLDFRFSLCLVY